MKTRTLIIIAAVLLVVPVLARTIWFYQGVFWRSQAIETPDYAGLALPVPPLSTAQPDQAVSETDAGIVVIDHDHYNNFATPDLDRLTQALVARGAHMEQSGVSAFNFSNSMKYASAYVVVAPTRAFSNEELLQVERFVERGGRLLVITDPTRNQPSLSIDPMSQGSGTGADVAAANVLLEPYGMSFENDYLYNLIENEGNFQNVIFQKFADDDMAGDLSKVAFYAAHSLRTVGATPLIVGDANTFSSITDAGDALVAAALSKNGQVLAIGDMTFLTPPYDQVLDNQVLISHICDFLLGGKRIHDLADFPYLFDRPVEVLPTEKVKLKSNLLTPLGSLQRKLDVLNIPVTMAEKPAEGKDLVVIGTYKMTEDLKPYVESFDLEFSAESVDAFPKPTQTGVTETPVETTILTPVATIIPENSGLLPTPEPLQSVESIGVDGPVEKPQSVLIPGLGRFAADGTGMMLYTREKDKNVLVLLADTTDNLPNLLDLLSSGDMTPCVQRGQLVICKLSESGGYSPSFEPQTPTEPSINPVG